MVANPVIPIEMTLKKSVLFKAGSFVLIQVSSYLLVDSVIDM